tara:strand:- start:2701 stop:2982 length:282 start_codon:yes stop_codon:yes gene_type:complete
MKKVEFTKLEKQVLKELVKRLDIDEIGYSDIYDKDLEKYTNIPMNILRGVLGSLVVKRVIFIVSSKDMGVPRTYGDSVIFIQEDCKYLFEMFK